MPNASYPQTEEILAHARNRQIEPERSKGNNRKPISIILQTLIGGVILLKVCSDTKDIDHTNDIIETALARANSHTRGAFRYTIFNGTTRTEPHNETPHLNQGTIGSMYQQCHAIDSAVEELEVAKNTAQAAMNDSFNLINLLPLDRTNWRFYTGVVERHTGELLSVRRECQILFGLVQDDR